MLTTSCLCLELLSDMYSAALPRLVLRCRSHPIFYFLRKKSAGLYLSPEPAEVPKLFLDFIWWEKLSSVSHKWMCKVNIKLRHGKGGAGKQKAPATGGILPVISNGIKQMHSYLTKEKGKKKQGSYGEFKSVSE